METIELKNDEVALIFNGNELKIKGNVESPSGKAVYGFVHRATHDAKWAEDQRQYVKKHFREMEREIDVQAKEQGKKRIQEQLSALEESLARMELVHGIVLSLPKELRTTISNEVEELTKEIEVYKRTLGSVRRRFELGTISEMGFLGLRFLLEGLASVAIDTFSKIMAKLEAHHANRWSFGRKESAYA